MKRSLKAFLILAVVVAVFIVAFSILFQGINRNLDDLQYYTYGDLNLEGIADGTYRGTFERFPIAVEVDVVVEDETVTSIFIVRHQSGQGEPAEGIVVPVIEAQSLNVEVVAGATYSSYAILLAIEQALEGARASS